jgi:hypothetical protein
MPGKSRRSQGKQERPEAWWLYSRGARPEKTDQRPRSDGPRDDGGDRVAAKAKPSRLSKLNCPKNLIHFSHGATSPVLCSSGLLPSTQKFFQSEDAVKHAPSVPCVGGAGAVSQCSIPPLYGQRDLWPVGRRTPEQVAQDTGILWSYKCVILAPATKQPKLGPRCAVKGVAISGHEHLDVHRKTWRRVQPHERPGVDRR